MNQSTTEFVVMPNRDVGAEGTFSIERTNDDLIGFIVMKKCSPLSSNVTYPNGCEKTTECFRVGLH